MKKHYLSKFLILLIGLILGASAFFFILKNQIANSHNLDFHEHADFALFIDGERFDFSEFRYMSVEPCTVPEISLVPTARAHGSEFDETELDEAVHLHNNEGGTIHVHRPGVTYEDFFASLQMEFHDEAFEDADGNLYEVNAEKEFRFIVNGEEVDTLASTEVRDLDRVLISYGDKNRPMATLMQEYGSITNNACINSESCSHREPATPESCSQEPTPKLLEMLGL